MNMLTCVVVERVHQAEGLALESELRRAVSALAPRGTVCETVRWEESAGRIVVELKRSVTLRDGFTSEDYRAAVFQPALDLVERSIAQAATDREGLQIRVLRNSLLVGPRIPRPAASGTPRAPRSLRWYRIAMEIDRLGDVALASVAREFAALLRERRRLRASQALDVPGRAAIALTWEAEAFDETDAAEDALRLAEDISWLVVPDANDMKMRFVELAPVTERREH